MSDLTTLRAQVASLLSDASHDRWATDELDDALRLALRHYSERRPRELETTLTLAEAGRELSLAGVSGLLRPLRVWWPYTAAEPAYPPRWVPWERHGTATLFLHVADEPQAGDGVRLFYAALHTVEGLDDETATTLAADEEGTLVVGAAGYAALARAAYVNEAVSRSERTPEQWHAWAESRLADFEKHLAPRYAPPPWPVWSGE